MNIFAGMGNLGSDAEVRVSKAGTAITSFSVAISSGWGDNKKTTWIKCALFGKKGTGQPHGLTEYLKKGSQVGVTGEIALDEWTAQDGSTKYTLTLNTRDVTLTKSQQHDGGIVDANKAAQKPAAGGFIDDDVPFAQFEKGLA